MIINSSPPLIKDPLENRNAIFLAVALLNYILIVTSLTMILRKLSNCHQNQTIFVEKFGARLIKSTITFYMH